MVKNYVNLRKNEKIERKIKMACAFSNAKYEFIDGTIINLDNVNVSIINPHRCIIRLNGKSIMILYFDEDNIFLYNRTMPVTIKQLKLILNDIKTGVIGV